MYAQIHINGSIQNSSARPLVNATITIETKQRHSILAYTFSNSLGTFHIIYSKSNINDTVIIKASLLGYHSDQIVLLSEPMQPISFVLKEQDNILPEVKIKANPIRLLKDTLSYDVNEFKDRHDRVISDIIKKLPGVEVDDNGRIRYNGKAISNYYINGDNLLDDRYNIANNSIPADAVLQVQILEKNQPVKLLRDVVRSDDVALNLKLKKSATLKLFGTATAGAGTESYNADINLLTFKDKFKAITTIRANNTGNDYLSETTAFNFEDYLKSIDNNILKFQHVISPTTLLFPSINKIYYNHNSSIFATFNYLLHLSADVTVKFNLHHLYNDIQYSETNNTSYLISDTVAIKTTEIQNSQSYLNASLFQATLESNKDLNYIKNDLKVTSNYENWRTGVLTNSITSNQLYSLRLQNINNDFKWIKRLRNKKIITFSSTLGYQLSPETLEILPGLYKAILNNDSAYKSILQNSRLPFLYSNTAISFSSLMLRKIRLTYKIGVNIQQQNLNTQISLLDNNSAPIRVADSLTNAIDWSAIKPYVSTTAFAEIKKMQFDVSIIANRQWVNYDKTKHFQQLAINPTVTIKRTIGQNGMCSLSLGSNNNVGTLLDVYPGYILRTYRELSNNRSDLVNAASNKASFGYTFRNPVKAFFFYTGISYTKEKKLILSSNTISQNLITTRSIPLVNYNTNILFFLTASKYYPKLRTTLIGKVFVEKNSGDQIQNNSLVAIRSKSMNTSVNLNSRIFENISLDLNAKLSFSSATIFNKGTGASTPVPATRENNIAGTLTFFFSKSMYTSVQTEYYQTFLKNQFMPPYFFINPKVTFKFKNKNELNLQSVNLLNYKGFQSSSIVFNQVSDFYFKLEGRKFLISYYLIF